MNEIWKAVEGHEGYEVSSLGNVRSYWRSGHKGLFDKPRAIQQAIGSHGYPVANLKGAVRCVHELVCIAFHGPKFEGFEVAHRDGTRINNNAENLRWATREENIQDCFLHKTLGRGELARNVKLTIEQVREIRRIRLKSGWGARRISKYLSLPYSRVNNVVNGNAWKGVD